MLQTLVVTILVILHVLVAGDQLDNTVDIGATVKEVENMLAKDPRLPRLTRGEILKLIDEVRTGKDVVVVLPDNQSTTLNDTVQSTTSKTRRPVKRRRKKPTVRPVYVHSTTIPDSIAAVNSSVASTPQTPTSQSEWIPSSTAAAPRVKTTQIPVPPGGLPPVPGLSVIENINSWTGGSNVSPGGKREPAVFITPTPAPVSFSTTQKPPIIDGLENPPNVKIAAESLGPEMKDLLTKFGLLGSESTTERFIHAAHPVPTIDPQVFSKFKPLPVKSSADAVSPDMKSFLASYGLLDSRQGKNMKDELTESSNPLDYIPNHEKDVLSQLGLWRDGKAIDVGESKLVPQHVFKPNKVEKTTGKGEMEKVSKILTKLKQIGEGHESELSPSDVEELLLLENNTRLAAQGDIDLNEEPDSQEDKNEVKRNPQGASASASVSVSSGDGASAFATAESSSEGNSTNVESEVSTDPLTVTTTELSLDSSSSGSEDTTERGASAADLEDSFGGGSVTTTKRPNGFYFLLDWNSFLDVGLDDRAIHLNFSPKVGNPANFLPVTIGNSQSRRR